MKYNLAIGNIGRVMLILLLMIVWFLTSSMIVAHFRLNALLFMMISFFPPIGFLILWLVFQKNKDVLSLSEVGIESESHGTIKWKDIKICSWESTRGELGIYLIFRNHKRLMISVPSVWKDFSKNRKALLDFFEEIKKHNFELKKEDRFKVCEGRMSKFTNTFILIVFISVPVIIMIMKLFRK